MNTTKYEVFARAVKLGSLSKAAEDMGYTQCGVSHMMKSLEQEVGFPLFTRTTAGIQPNTEGEMLLPLVWELLQRNERLEETIASIKGLETGHISIASFSSVAIFLLPSILRAFEHKHPNIHVQINEGGVDVIEELLETGEVDLAIYARTARTSFDWIPLREDPLYAVLPKDHPLATRDVFPIETFLSEDFIAPDRDYDYDIHRVLSNLSRFPRVKYTSRNDFAIIAMVECGLGLTILPQLLLQDSTDKVAILPLDPPFHRSLGIGVLNQKDISPAVARFIRLVRKMTGATDTVLLP